MLAQHLPEPQENRGCARQPGVSEIVMPAGGQETGELILPMLAHLSQQSKDRWLTWISPDVLPKQLYRSYGFSLKNVRTIHSSNDEQSLWIMWDALNNGTSDYVVAGFNQSASVTKRERRLLETACQNGNARALILKFFE